MRIEFTYSRSPAYLRGQLRAGAWAAALPLLELAGVLGVVGAVVVVARGGPKGDAVGIVLVIVAALLALRARWRFVDAVTVPPAWCKPRAWTITEEALESRTELTSTTWKWAAVRRVEERPEAYLFWQQDAPTVFDVPREPLTAAQEDELRAQLAGRGLIWPVVAAV